MCGPEDGHETAGPTGATRGSGLPPVNDCDPEGLRSGWAVGGGAGPAGFYWCLLVELCEERTLL